MKQKGFTLVELMVTVALLAIVLGLAVPAFQELIRNNKLVTQTNSLVTAFNLARSEAIKRNTQVHVSSGTLAGGCVLNPGAWNQGLYVWVDDAAASNTLDNCAELLRQLPPVTEGVGLAADSADTEVIYSAAGAADTSICFDVTQTGGAGTRVIQVSATGAITVAKNGACP